MHKQYYEGVSYVIQTRKQNHRGNANTNNNHYTSTKKSPDTLTSRY